MLVNRRELYAILGIISLTQLGAYAQTPPPPPQEVGIQDIHGAMIYTPEEVRALSDNGNFSSINSLMHQLNPAYHSLLRILPIRNEMNDSLFLDQRLVVEVPAGIYTCPIRALSPFLKQPGIESTLQAVRKWLPTFEGLAPTENDDYMPTSFISDKPTDASAAIIRMSRTTTAGLVSYSRISLANSQAAAALDNFDQQIALHKTVGQDTIDAWMYFIGGMDAQAALYAQSVGQLTSKQCDRLIGSIENWLSDGSGSGKAALERSFANDARQFAMTVDFSRADEEYERKNARKRRHKTSVFLRTNCRSSSARRQMAR